MKNILSISLILLIASCNLFKKKEKVDVNKVYTVVDVQPQFPGGEEAMFQYLGKNIKYPPKAKEAGVQGKVYVQFIVERDGSISTVKVIRGIGSGCDEVAIKAVENMPKWSPGEIKKQKVRTRFVLPISYTLR